MRYGPGVGQFPDWWPAYQAAARLGLAEWEYTGEPRPAKYWWFLRRDLAAWAEARAAQPLVPTDKDS